VVAVAIELPSNVTVIEEFEANPVPVTITGRPAVPVLGERLIAYGETTIVTVYAAEFMKLVPCDMSTNALFVLGTVIVGVIPGPDGIAPVAFVVNIVAVPAGHAAAPLDWKQKEYGVFAV
jgi:hypothetical protein